MARAYTYQKELEAIKILILELSHLSGADFVMQLDAEIEPDKIKEILRAIDLYLLKGIPVQHILGYTYFFGYKIFVNQDVLIPRFETEELVGQVLSYYDNIFKGKPIRTVDIGTGSGAIAIALALEEPKMEVYATDISDKALKVAFNNATYNKAKVKFIKGSWLEPLFGLERFDLIVSNPPYIPIDEEVDPIVKNNEPHLALYGGKRGMDFYEVILKDANKILNVPGLIAFEHSYNKKQEIYQLAKKYFPNALVDCITDMQGKDRMTLITIKEVMK